jgi:DNA-binding CsgD family transcriptional regulator
VKNRKNSKKALRDYVGFEADATPTPTVPFNWEEIYEHDEKSGGQEHPVPTNASMNEALEKAGVLSAFEKSVALGKLNGKSTREIAKALGKSKTTVSKTLKHIGPLLQTRSRPGPLNRSEPTDYGVGQGLPPQPLKAAMESARKSFVAYVRDPAFDLGYKALGLSELNLVPECGESERAIAYITLWPQVLLDPTIGPYLLRQFVETLTSARYGRKPDAQAARKVLSPLTKRLPGNRCPIPDDILGSESLSICVTVANLHRAWRKRNNDVSRETKGARVDFIRGRFGPIVEGFTNGEILSLMQSDVLHASARLAAEATGFAEESFRRAWKQIPEIERLGSVDNL